jgi:hypothetical protein
MLHYRIFGNGGSGGPVDYSTIIVETASLSFSPPALGAPSDNTFAIHTFNTVTGLEEAGVDARVHIVIDASGVDITNRPAAPLNLGATVLAGGSVAIHWQKSPIAAGGRPTGFHIYIGTPTPNYSSIAATVPDTGGGQYYTHTLTGLTDGVTYQAGVRAYNSTAEEPNTNVVSFTADSTGPSNVDAFAITLTGDEF